MFVRISRLVEVVARRHGRIPSALSPHALSHNPCILNLLASPNQFSDDAYHIYNSARVLNNIRIYRVPRYKANCNR